jgi:hypothetical protein
MPRIQSSRAEDVEYDGGALEETFQDSDCWLIALDDWEIAVILSSLRYAHWQKRWRNLGTLTWDEIQAKVENLEHCLMAGCNVSELLDKLDALVGKFMNDAGSITDNLTNINENLVGALYHGDKGLAEIVSELELVVNTAGATVNFDTEAIADAIIAQTTMQETRSIAEVTGQNTNFSDLVEAVNGLELSAICSPDVTVNCGSSGGGCCGGEGTTPPPSGPATGGGTPPMGYVTPPNTTYDRKCKVANYIIDSLRKFLHELDVNHVDEFGQLGTAIAISTATALIGAALGSEVPVFGNLFGAIVGGISGLVIAFVVGVPDLTAMVQAIDAYRQEMVCALYSAADAEQAKENLKDVFSEAGASWSSEVYLGALGVLDALLGNYAWLNILFFTPEEGGQDIEAELDGYDPPTPCDGCNARVMKYQDPNVSGLYVEIPGGYPGPGETQQYTVNSIQSGSYYYASGFTWTTATPSARATSHLTINSISGGFGDSYGSCMQLDNTEYQYTNNVRTLIGTEMDYFGVGIIGNAPFTLVFTIRGQ